MFDQIPPRVLLLLVIAIAAYAPAVYIYKHVANSPSKRDITQPSMDVSWRTPSKLWRAIALLAGLAGLAIFIFTPIAARFAQSPSFLPILTLVGGSWAIWTVVRGYLSGSIEPIVRGANWIFKRDAQPRRYWASMAWNALFGFLCLFLSYDIYQDAPRQSLLDRCYNEEETFHTTDIVLACNELIARREGDDEEQRRLLTARGSAYYLAKDYERAKIDYVAVLRLDPQGSYAHYNLGLVCEQLEDRSQAVASYGAAIRADPKNADAYANRGLIFLDTKRLDRAIFDFTRARELEPNNTMLLANRGIAYAWKNDRERARQDFEVVRASEPSNVVVLRGEALLAMTDGDTNAAVRNLTAAINQNPNDTWSLSLRAEAFKRQGEYEKMQADADAVLRANKELK